jgi:branched-chain amino acid transport system permease protein
VNGRVLAYYLVFFVSLLVFLLLLRVVNSPFGRVLQAIRENEFRPRRSATASSLTAPPPP